MRTHHIVQQYAHYVPKTTVSALPLLEDKPSSGHSQARGTGSLLQSHSLDYGSGRRQVWFHKFETLIFTPEEMYELDTLLGTYSSHTDHIWSRVARA